MNLNELKKRIKQEGLNICKHNVDFSPIQDDEIGLLRNGEMWEVYQSHERGGHHIIKSFDNENDACDLIYKYLSIEKKGKDRFKELKRSKR